MAREDGFSIITVRSDDEDEVVIHAGRGKDSREEDVLDAGLSGPSDEDPSGQVPENDAPEQPNVEDTCEDVREGQEDDQPHLSSDYKERIKEELGSSPPQQKMQRVIIACVIVFLVGFLAYYFFLHNTI